MTQAAENFTDEKISWIKDKFDILAVNSLTNDELVKWLPHIKKLNDYVNKAGRKKKKLLESKRFRDDFTFEEMHDNDYKNFIVSIAPQYERKDQFGHGTIQGQGPSMGDLEMQDVARY